MNKSGINYHHDAPRSGCHRLDFVRVSIWSLNAPTSDCSLESQVSIYRHNQNIIAIVAVRPKVVLG
jgi:hypothetical protein